MTALSNGLLERLKARAGDPAKRSESAALSAGSINMAEMVAGMPRSDDPAVKDYLEGVNSPLAGMMSNLVTGDGRQAKGMVGLLSGLLGNRMMLGQMGTTAFRMGAEPESQAAQPPASEAEVEDAEAELGFPLPAELRQFYVEVANGGVGPGAGIFSLRELTEKRHEMTREPVGPQGQDWPANLLPIEGDRWDLTCIDRDSGKLVFWDVEELDDEDEDPDNATWNASFKPEAESLEAWLNKWTELPG